MIAYDTQDTVAGYRMHERLEERLGNATTARYQLSVTINQGRRPAAITDDGDTTRYNLTGTANWTLTDLNTGDKIDSGKVNGFTSYSATGSTTATQSATTDATARLSVMLADMVVARVLVLAPQLAQ